jgi:peptidyl-prolyl cis-trans isomerase C
MKKLAYVFLFIAVTVFFCGYALAGDDALLAKVGDKKITVSDFNRFLSSYPPAQQKFLQENPKNKQVLLRRMVQVLTLSDIARAKGMEKDPRIKQQIDYYTNEILAQELLKQELAKIDVTDEDLKTYYTANKKSFEVPEMVHARHILIKVDARASAEEKQKAREKAEDVLKKIKAGGDFAQLAEEYSDDPGSKAKGGDLGFFGRGRMVQPFEDAAFSLKPGEVSGLVETQFGFHIIKVEEKKAAGVEPFEEAKEEVRQRVLDEMGKVKTKNFVEDAMKDAKAEIHPELLLGEPGK